MENVIQLIQPRIDNLKIYPVRINDLEQSIYVVKIPRSGNAPHMARDKRYYKRFNFKSEPMEDYEVKDLYNRTSIPKLEITGCLFSHRETDTEIEYELVAGIANNGSQVCESYKLNFYINLIIIYYIFLKANINSYIIKMRMRSQDNLQCDLC